MTKPAATAGRLRQRQETGDARTTARDEADRGHRAGADLQAGLVDELGEPGRRVRPPDQPIHARQGTRGTLA